MFGNKRYVKKASTSWEPVGSWYQSIVGEEGHYYHQTVIIPKLLALMEFSETKSPALLDLACGSGVLARVIPPDVPYLGIDISPTLIKAAKEQDQNRFHEYVVADLTKPLKLRKDFSHAFIILALQNIGSPSLALKNSYTHLRPGGKLFIVLNHPCFRIPRQSSWGVDEKQKIQYRRIDRYQSSMEIPIQAHPSKGSHSPSTLSFHYPLSSYSKWLKETGFLIEMIDEWCSEKVSTGKAAKMENRSREEIPLFLCLVAKKLS
jgi:SAM-dependent methyltransferase